MNAQTFALPATAPDCPFQLDIYVGSHYRVWVSAGAPETEAEWKARQEAEGEDYFPRFWIQADTFDGTDYDCWEASEYWADMLAEVADGIRIGEEADYCAQQGFPPHWTLRELLGVDPWRRIDEERPVLTEAQRAKLSEFFERGAPPERAA